MKSASALEERAFVAVERMFDKHTGFMVPKSSRGEKVHGFNPITWGSGFTEGSSWHHSFPPYALDLLVKLHGGNMMHDFNSEIIKVLYKNTYVL